MLKFKKGDLIKRVDGFQPWAPRGYEAEVLENYVYKDSQGDFVDIYDEMWELVKPAKQQTNEKYQIF